MDFQHVSDRFSLMKLTLLSVTKKYLPDEPTAAQAAPAHVQGSALANRRRSLRAARRPLGVRWFFAATGRRAWLRPASVSKGGMCPLNGAGQPSNQRAPTAPATHKQLYPPPAPSGTLVFHSAEDFQDLPYDTEHFPRRAGTA